MSLTITMFHVEIEPTSWHAWVELPSGEVIDWNNGMPTAIQVSMHDRFEKSKLRRPFRPVYEEVSSIDLKAQQREAVKQWMVYSLKHWPQESWLVKWEPSEGQCLINSFVAAKRYGGRVVFGKFGWQRKDGTKYYEFDGQTTEQMVEEMLQCFMK